jgi:uncharacterized protein (DUF433 family)
MIVGQIGAGVSVEELLNDYPYLEREDIMQALQYAAGLPQQKAKRYTDTDPWGRTESAAGCLAR